ncbi:hypothetical protein [Vibrio aestuarianus]|uniref:hypothetical protein n=1 Tax=Vibrio aestuarianus TaxID=28171 RepID=UPI00237D1857|nr:hypothetical protein [Vibrio aestuarianus]MDE1333416.1 hypothetical protein [Vibrio aestuarianus]
MKHLLTLAEQKHILSLYIIRASGRPRELLELLLCAYPKPMSGKEIKLALNMTGAYALPSVVRNAAIFIDVTTRKEGKTTYYQLDDTCVAHAAANQLMNALVKPRSHFQIE